MFVLSHFLWTSTPVWWKMYASYAPYVDGHGFALCVYACWLLFWMSVYLLFKQGTGYQCAVLRSPWWTRLENIFCFNNCCADMKCICSSAGSCLCSPVFTCVVTLQWCLSIYYYYIEFLSFFAFQLSHHFPLSRWHLIRHILYPRLLILQALCSLLPNFLKKSLTSKPLEPRTAHQLSTVILMF